MIKLKIITKQLNNITARSCMITPQKLINRKTRNKNRNKKSPTDFASVFIFLILVNTHYFAQ